MNPIANSNTPDPNSGTATPSDAGQQTTIQPSNSDGSTVAQTAAPDTPQSTPQGAPSGAPTGASPNSTPVQNTTPPGQQQQQQTPGKQPDLSKAPAPNPAQVQDAVAQAQKKKAVTMADRFHATAEALAGGPRYTYGVDEYGVILQNRKVPVSNAHLALSIAMEALSGAAAGLGVANGPNAAGRAAAAGFNKGEQNRVQEDQQARTQATEDFARRAQVTETNMRMYSNARALSNQDASTIDSYIGQWSDIANRMESQYPGYFKEVTGYQGLSKYNVTSENAIPYKRIARLGPDGKQAVGSKNRRSSMGY